MLPAAATILPHLLYPRCPGTCRPHFLATTDTPCEHALDMQRTGPQPAPPATSLPNSHTPSRHSPPPNSPWGQRRTRGDPRWSPEPAKSIQTTRPEARSVVFPANAPPRLGATCWRGSRFSRVAPHGTSCRASCSRRSVRTDAVLTTTVSV